MQIEITDQQREHVHNMLITHIHNMLAEANRAHGIDEKKSEFYWERHARAESLLHLFAPPQEEEESDSEEDEELDGDGDEDD